MTAAAHPSSAVAESAAEKWLVAFRRMQMIRHFGDRVNGLYLRALIPGLAHLYAGEEAVAVGICEALRRDDYIPKTRTLSNTADVIQKSPTCRMMGHASASGGG